MDWLLREKCPWDISVCRAVECGELKYRIRTWLRRNNCPCQGKVCKIRTGKRSYDSDEDECSDDEGWMFLQEIWKSVYEPEVCVEDAELVVESNHVEIMRIAVPDWILRLDGLISFLKDSRGGRIPTAMEFKELLVNLWFPEFC